MKRLDYLDIAKGIAIFLVVMGHAVLGEDLPEADEDEFRDLLLRTRASGLSPIAWRPDRSPLSAVCAIRRRGKSS